MGQFLIRTDAHPSPAPPSSSGPRSITVCRLIFRLDVRFNLLSSLVAFNFDVLFRFVHNTIFVRVKRGASQQNPQKYVLDDQELQRVSALARIELEDAKTELQRAQQAANAVLERAASGVHEGGEDDGDDSAWVE